MKFHIGAPLLTLAIFFNFIELSSQYNKDLTKDDMTIPDYLDIFYTMTDNLDVVAYDGHNAVVYGLIHTADGQFADDRLVCALEKDNDRYWARKLMVDGRQVTVDAANYYYWTDDDTSLYQIEFDKVIS
ncbi:uncharacterized protein LOC117173001 [Belonocnema kinseyi]|uniref:uncharacterized protein LOC117173001 n=1 Tax=Belonocnema kinseyi TaxID=2817044 RepID=UPI00143DDFEF|nr:uncharacterized protein LOC117173001 [Belonocnema kinseyi]